jgi:hypothetical protein
MRFKVRIPSWQFDERLTIEVEAENESDAYQKAVDWVNAYAGFHYCNKLPIDTIVYKDI